MSSTDPVATSTPSGNGKSPPIMKSPADFDEVIPLPHEEGITVPGPSSPGPPASTNLPPNQLAYPKIKVAEKSRLCEINPGVWDGLSPDDVQNRYPAEWEDFQNDPYGHRAPRAESYHDLCIRLEPILIELEDCKDDLLIISHASVIRCLLAYLVGLPAHEVPAVDIARGDLIEVQPSAYGVKTRMFHFWSGPGRKDAEGAATKGLDREMEEAEAKASEDAAVAAREEGVRKIYGPGIDTDVNSPPKSKLHLDRAYKSRNPSQADLSEMMGTMTPQEETTATGKRKAKHGEDGSGNGIWKVDDGVARRDSRILDEGMRQALSRAMTPSTSIFPDGEEDVKDSPADLRGPEPPAGDQEPKKTEEETPDIVPPPAPEVVKEKGGEEEEPTQASKVLPKVERSLGADEALRVAAEKEAADMRPTFYENVVEGAVKPKKLGASGTLVTSTPNLAPREIGSA